jgi:chemotaxis protein methyltransferase WspC
MPLKDIKSMLKQAMGLHADSIGDSSVRRAVEHRMATLSLSDMKGYVDRVLSDNDELIELIEEIIVPETWFFRNINSFNALRDCAASLKGKATHERLDVLSIPCSSGEEAYSIVMALLEAGFSRKEFHVDAIDISNRSLRKAKRGIYGKHSFREEGETEYWQAKYFSKTVSGYKIDPELKSCVSFRHGNILSPDLTFIEKHYDIIFCRNLLIYFDRKMQKEALSIIHRALKDDGILFIGHGETSQLTESQFEKIPSPRAFAYRKTPQDNKNRGSKDVLHLLGEAYSKLEDTIRKGSLTVLPKVKGRYPVVDLDSAGDKEKVSHLGASVSNIGLVEKAIQDGDILLAENLCEKYLELNTESAEGYYFRGLIAYLLGSEPSAEECLKKALYLDPNNYHALGLLAILAEKKGDGKAADAYRRREERVIKRKPHINQSSDK